VVSEATGELGQATDAERAIATSPALVGELLGDEAGDELVIDRGGVLAGEVGEVNEMLSEVLRAPSEQLLGGQLVEAEPWTLKALFSASRGSW
jgi:hypothetical protein